MKFLATSLVIFLASALSVQAGEPVSATSLDAVGLGGMNVMSDAQGDEIRAKFVFGVSTASTSQTTFIAGGAGGPGFFIGGVYYSNGSASGTNGYIGNSFGVNGTFAAVTGAPSAAAGGFSSTN